MTFTRMYQRGCDVYMELIYGPETEGIPYDYVAENLRRHLINQCKIAISNPVEIKVSINFMDREIKTKVLPTTNR